MTIWVGHDGTLHDDEGDGPAAVGQVFVGQDGLIYVGDDDFGSALGSIGGALGSAFGGSGGGGGDGGSGGGGFDFGSAVSSLSSAFGGSGGNGSGMGGGGGDAGSAIANIFGQVAKAAAPVAAQAVSHAFSQGTTPHPQSQAVQHPSESGTPQGAHPATHPAAHPAAAHPRQAGSPKTRLNILLSHYAKDYGMPAPDKTPLDHAGDFMNNMMSPSSQGSGATKTSGLFDAEGGVLDRLASTVRRFFSPHADARRYSPRAYPHGYSRPFSLPFGGAQPESYFQSQPLVDYPAYHAPPVTYHAPTAAYHAPPVTYQPYAMPAQEASHPMTQPTHPKMVSVSASAPRADAHSMFGQGSMSHGGAIHGGHGAAFADEGVRATQKLLNDYWHYPFLVEDGVMGSETIRYLTEFQRQQGLPQTGLDDEATHALLLKHPLAWGSNDASDSGDSRTGIQSTSMYNPHDYYTDSYGAYVLPLDSWIDENGEPWVPPSW